MRRIGGKKCPSLLYLTRWTSTPTKPSRVDVIRRWNVENTTASTSSFLTTLSTTLRNSENIAVIGGVTWCRQERLDFYLYYWAPVAWAAKERVRNNFISIDMSPPMPKRSDIMEEKKNNSTMMDDSKECSNRAASGDEERYSARSIPTPSVHGINITSFAYHYKISQPNADALLDTFLLRFSSFVGNTLKTEARSTPMVKQSAAGTGKKIDHGVSESRPHHPMVDGQASASTPVEEASSSGQQLNPSGSSMSDAAMVEHIATTTGGSSVVISFVSSSGEKAKGLCRAAFHTNRRFHYVVLAVVPEEEFDLSRDLLTQAVVGVREVALETRKD